VFSIAIPSAISYFLSYGEWELLTVFVRRMGPAEVTTWSLMGYVWSAFEVLTSGFSSAAEVRVGFRMGANKPEQAKFMAEKGMYVTTVVAIFECGIIFSIAQYLPAWITPDPTLQQMLFQLTPMIGFGSILMVTGFVAWSIVYATGRVKLATMWEVIVTWCITVPGCATMAFLNFNLEGFVGAMIIGYAVGANLYMFMLLRTDWAKQAKRISEKHSGGLKYLDTDWDRLPRKIRAAAVTLGYNKQMWESNDEPPSNSKNWSGLTPAEQSAAAAFGFNRKKVRDDRSFACTTAFFYFAFLTLLPLLFGH
jgi:MatE